MLPLSTVPWFASSGPHSCPRTPGKIERSPPAETSWDFPGLHSTTSEKTGSRGLCLAEKVAPTWSVGRLWQVMGALRCSYTVTSASRRWRERTKQITGKSFHLSVQWNRCFCSWFLILFIFCSNLSRVNSLIMFSLTCVKTEMVFYPLSIHSV